jgi:hypothetical protein
MVLTPLALLSSCVFAHFPEMTDEALFQETTSKMKQTFLANWNNPGI